MRRLEIDWVTLPSGNGREVGMTLLPGRIDEPRGRHSRVLSEDLARLSEAGTERLILLSDDTELEQLGAEDLPRAAAAAGIHVIRRPLHPRQMPSVKALAEVGQRVLDAQPRRVVVTSRSGLVRTGLVVAASLVLEDVQYAEAVALVQEVRGSRAAAGEGVRSVLHRLQTAIRGYREQSLPGSQLAQLPNDELRLAAVPDPGAPFYPDVFLFAPSFAGYDYMGDSGALGHLVALMRRAYISDGRFPVGLTLADYRAALFLHGRHPVSDEALTKEAFARALLVEIRRILREHGRL